MTYDAKTLKISHRTLKPKNPKHYLNPKPWPLNKTPWYPKVLDNENMFSYPHSIHLGWYLGGCKFYPGTWELVSSKYPSKGRLESRLLSTIHIKKIYKDKPFFTSDIDMGEKLRVS
jgi:hypothetical protein